MNTNRKDKHILIIGAGVFGLTLARELHHRGYRNITILDRYVPPVPDGSSVDISRVIRPDYADSFYAKMALEALQGWKSEFAPYFHPSALLTLSESKRHPYIQQSKNNLRAMGLSVEECTGDQAKEKFHIQGNISKMEGYWNSGCGWANAQGSIRYLAQQCSAAGISFITGPHGTVTSLVKKEDSIVGVRTKAGTTIPVDICVIASGAWTPLLLDMSRSSISTGQPVGFLQLTPAEAKALEGCPIMINMTSGWFCFPPTADGVLKVVRHGYGYETTKYASEGHPRREPTSAPSLERNNASSSFLPPDAEKALRDGLNSFFPQFRDRNFLRQRLCWYTDTPKGDFIVDYHPDYDNLFLASGGSGHAFKFLPVLGRYTADNFEMKASRLQKEKWAWQPSKTPISKGDGSRGGPPRRVLSREEQAKL